MPIQTRNMADVEEPPVPEVADTAPALVDIDSVRSAQPIGAYVVPEDADSILKSFLSEVNDVARDSEVVRCADTFHCYALRLWIARAWC